MNNQNTSIAFMNLSAIVSIIICFVYACAISIYNINILNNIIKSSKVETNITPVIERTYIIGDLNGYRSDNNIGEFVETISNDITIETKTVTYYDVPLNHELQDYIFTLCEERGIDPAIIIAMIEKESSFRESVIGDHGNSYGLMQIQPKWNKARMEALGCNDLLDPYQNVMVGVDILSEYMSKGNSIEWALMAYNGGPTYANKKAKQGIVSDYAVFVLDRAKNLVRV